MSTPTFPLDPPGIDAAGMSKVAFVTALSDPLEPLVTEVAAGVDLSCALYAFAPDGQQSTVERAKYCYRQTVQTLGRETWTIEAIEYDYDPQDLANPAYDYYEDLAPGTRGYIFDRRGLDAKTVDWAASQLVDIYPVQLGIRTRVAINPGAEGEKLRSRQVVAIVGEVLQDIALVTAGG